MKLLSFSDLHIDYNNEVLGRNSTFEIASYIREMRPDRVIVAGDMAGGSQRCLHYINELEDKTGIPISYVPGNHSIWCPNKELDSWHEYEQLKNHPSSLIDRPVHLNDEWVLIGDMGWYDYSYKEENMSRDEVFRQKQMIWKDSVMARFGMEDEELTELMLSKFRRQIEANADKKIIFVNHFIPYAEYVPISPRSEVWNMIRPFMGSSRLGELLDSYEQVKYVIFGHKHWRHGYVERENGKKIICNPLGYVKEWRTSDLMQELRSSGTIIRL